MISENINVAKTRDKSRTSHQWCSVKKLFLKISQYSQKSLLESPFNEVESLHAKPAT